MSTQSISTRTIEIDGVTIAYKEKNENASRSIFFIHGNSSSSDIWLKQLENEKLKEYWMIAIDLPAHGESSADPELKYGIIDMASSMAKMIDKISSGNPYILAGVSLGTNIIAEMLAFSSKPSGLIFLGPTLVGDEHNQGNIFLPDLDMRIMFSEQAAEEDLRAFYKAALYNENPAAIKNMVNDFIRTQPKFRSEMIAKASDGKISNELNLLRRNRIPALIIFGVNENLVNPFYMDKADIPKWKNKVFKMDDAGHFAHVDQPEKVNELIAEYVQEIFAEKDY